MKELFLKNFSLKFLSIASALVLWFIVLGLQNAPQEFEAPLEIKPFNLSEQYTVAGQLPYAKVKILADKEVQRQIRPEDFDAYIDLRNVEPGKVTSTVYVTSKNPKVTIVSISPESVTAAIEKRSEKEMNIEYEITGEVKEGFELKSVKITPQKIRISGAGSTLSAIEKVKIQLVMNGTQDHTFVLSRMALVDQNGSPLQGLKITPESIDATVEISPTQQEKVVPVKPRFAGALKNGFVSKVTVRPNVITLRADGKILDNIVSIETEALDLDKITKTGSYFVNPVLPKDTQASPGLKVELYLEISEAI